MNFNEYHVLGGESGDDEGEVWMSNDPNEREIIVDSGGLFRVISKI